MWSPEAIKLPELIHVRPINPSIMVIKWNKWSFNQPKEVINQIVQVKVTRKILEKVLVSWQVGDLKDLRWSVKLIRPTWCVIFHSHILRMLTCYSESKENRKKQILIHAIICIERPKITNKISVNLNKKCLRTLGAKNPNVF